MAEPANTPKAFIHPQAIVETENVGAGTRVWAFAHILPGARIGQNCNVCDHTFIEGRVVVGDNVTIKCGVYLWDGVVIEDDVFIGPNATFTNDIRPRSKAYPPEYARTLIKTGASIGANATVMCGITVGQWAMVGAGSVVTHDVCDYGLVYGNPAKLQGYVCHCAAELAFENSVAECRCGRSYVLETDDVVRRR